MNKDVGVAEVSQAYLVAAAEQTEVGVINSSGINLNATGGGPQGGDMDNRCIPEGWGTLAFVDALTIRHGKDKKAVESIDGQFPIFGTGGQMGWASEYLYDKPSVLIGRKGSINKPRYMETPFWTVDTLFYSEIKKDFNAKFVFYKFCMINWELYNEASGVPSLNASTIEGVTALFPAYKEQAAIANALSDVDALLSELEKLIAKKQAIKTATMQQLLTGRTRLPQFALREDGSPKGYKQSELGEVPEDWEVEPFGSLLSIRHGKSQRSVEAEGGNYPILATGGQIGWATSYLWDKPSVLIGRKGTIDKPRYIDKPFWTVDTLFYSEIKCRADAKFVYYKFCMVDWRQYNEASGVPSLNGSTIEGVCSAIPGKSEQTAIATILSDMDEEIQALEQRLNKTRQIKQGMMQELLTGKTRLVTTQVGE